MESVSTLEDTNHFKVVVGIDFSTASGPALRRAFAIANATEAGEVHAVAVAQYARAGAGVDALPLATLPPNFVNQLQDLVSTSLSEFAREMGKLSLRRVVTHVLSGDPAKEIIWLAARLNADLVVVGTHGRRGTSRLLLGSVAEHVVRTAGCPVYVERAKHHNEAWKVPEIEPPCPECLKAREASGGTELWCVRHVEHHIHKHLYSYPGTADSFRPWGFTNN
jgi:nucleotide-binding universal stress UspA family protein